MSKALNPLRSALAGAAKGSIASVAPAAAGLTNVSVVDVVYMTSPGSGTGTVQIPEPSECPGHIMTFVLVQDGGGDCDVNYTVGEVTTTDPIGDTFTVLGETAVLISTGFSWEILHNGIA